MSEHAESESPASVRKWKPLGSIERRVLGTLVEKAKTTDTYPMSLNALTNGCNQKSNRDPQMSLEPHQVEDALEKLRSMGAVAEVQGDSRVAKYRHYAYDWLGVDKYEIAVMAELLLRGAQTVGELRGRAARMESIADVAALRPILESLTEKELLISLTPAGRGQMVTHNLYLPEQLEKVKRTIGSAVPPAAASQSHNTVSTVDTSQSGGAECGGAESNSVQNQLLDELRAEMIELRSDVDRLKDEMEDLRQAIRG